MWIRVLPWAAEARVRFPKGDHLWLSNCHGISVWNRRGAWLFIVQIDTTKFLGARGASRHPALTISIHVCPVYLVDEKFFVLLVLSEEMRMIGESEILSFFVYRVNQGGWGGAVGPRFCCVTQRVKLTLRPTTSRVVQFVVFRVFVDDSVIMWENTGKGKCVSRIFYAVKLTKNFRLSFCF